MQTDKIQNGIQDLAKRLVSLDPVEHNSAINAYYEPNASYQSSFLNIHGASRIKKVLYLRSVLARKSEYVGEAEWDEANQILTLNTATQFGLPVALHPFDLTITVPGKIELHLNADESGEADDEGEGRKLYVTKMNLVRSTDWLTELPVVHFFHSTFILPFLSLALLVSAGTLSFWEHHSLKDGVFAFIVAAIHEIWYAIQGEVARQIAGRGWDARTAQDDVNSLKKQAGAMASEAVDAIQDKAGAVKNQAPNSVDEAKEQASSAYDEAQSKGADMANKTFKAVDEAKQQASSVAQDVKEQAPGLLNEVKGQASAAAQSAKSKASGLAPDTDRASPADAFYTPDERSWAAVAADETVDPPAGQEPLQLLDKGEPGDSAVPQPGQA